MASQAAGRRLPSLESLELAIPECEKGIGAVIGAVDSPDLIAGVRVQPLAGLSGRPRLFSGSAADRAAGWRRISRRRPRRYRRR